MSGAGWFWIAAGALLLGAVFSALFQSLRAVTRTRLEQMDIARGGPTRRITRILADPDGHATAVGLPRIASNLIVVVCLVYWIARLQGGSSPTPRDAVLGIAIASLLIWVFGLLLPNSIASHAAESVVLTWAPLLRALYILQS